MNEIFTPTLLWAVLGVCLIVVELLTSSFFLLFFGISALIVSGLRVIGLDHLSIEMAIFAVLGLAGTLIFRKKIRMSMQSSKKIKGDRDQRITLSKDIPANGSGSIVYRGTTWTALNNSEYDMKKGETAFIERLEGVKIILKSEQGV